MNLFKGAGVALVTPFNADMSIDFPALRRLVQEQIAGGTNYLVVQGTTGESPTLNSSEKKQVLETVLEENNGKLPIVYGAGGNNTLSVIEAFKNIPKGVDGILADLGVSSHQFDVAERGFSTRFDAELDMRMNQKGDISAYHVVNEYDEQDIARVLFDYGELKNARAMANVIVTARKDKEIRNSDELKKVLAKFLPGHKSNKILAQIYQAIRIEVNQEMDVLKEFLEQSLEILKPGGRLSVISYHSLEDRLVKRFVKNGMFEGEPERDFFGNFEVPFKTIEKLIVPTEEEIAINNRARSAKLRVAEKL